MTPQELKNSILQLAVQGKLVEQRAEEGTAEELYAKIQAEKQQLIADKKIKKEKPLPEITAEEIPFDIPESWKWIRLGEISSIFGGKRIPAGRKLTTDDTGHIYIRISDMKDGTVLKDNLLYVPSDIYNSIAKYIIKKEDVYITVAGTIGRVGKIPSELDGANLTENADRIVFSSLEQDWLIKCLESPAIQTQINNITTKVGQPKLAIKRIQELLVPLPPLEEQKRIVAKIEELLPQIDRYEQSWSKLEAFNKRFPDDMQKSILQYAVQGKLVEQRAEEGTAEELYAKIQAEKQQLIADKKIKKSRPLPEIVYEDIPVEFPKTWKVCYLDDIAFVTKLAGFEYTKNIAPNLTLSGIPLFKGKNVQNGRIVFEFDSYISEKISDELPRSQIIRRCLLTPYVGTIGNIAIFEGNFKAHLGSNVGKIEILNSNETYILEEYVLYYLRSQIGFQELTKYKKSTAQESISIDAIRNVIIGIPPLEEQKRIVAKIEELLPLCEKLKK